MRPIRASRSRTLAATGSTPRAPPTRPRIRRSGRCRRRRRSGHTARSSIYRAFPYAQAAGVEDSDPLAEDEDIVALNDDVGRRFAADDPRRHYRLIGAVWLRDGAAAFRVGEEIDDAALSGERALSNVALESLTQVGAPNCFSCHAPMSESGLPDRSINISRVFAKFA